MLNMAKYGSGRSWNWRLYLIGDVGREQVGVSAFQEELLDSRMWPDPVNFIYAWGLGERQQIRAYFRLQGISPFIHTASVSDILLGCQGGEEGIRVLPSR